MKEKWYTLKMAIHRVFSKEAVLASIKKTGVKKGAYQGGLTVLVILILVIANLVAGQLPSNINTLDLSEEQVLELSKTSKEYLGDLDEKLQFIVLADKNDADPTIASFIEKYAATSKNISVQWVDPVLHPGTLSTYSAEANSVVIKNKATEDFEVISFSSIYSSSYDSSYQTVTTFDGDGQFTSAVHSLTNDTSHKIYLTSGHNEQALGASITALFDKANYETADLNTVLTADIPDDCDLLLINAPETDFTEDEVKNLESYVASGGKLMILPLSQEENLPNLTQLMKDYGLKMTEGYIADSTRSYQGQAYYLFPNVTATGDYLQELTNQMVLIPNTKGFTEVDPKSDDITVTQLLATSSDGYNVTEDDQVQGTYTLGVVATQSVAEETAETTSESGKETTESSSETEDSTSTASSDETTTEDVAAEGRVTILASSSIIDETMTTSLPTLENNTFFMNTVTANFDGVENISIEAKTMNGNTNTVQQAGGISIIAILLLPILILAAGFVTWFRRRKA